jgi:HEAT repeat protein
MFRSCCLACACLLLTQPTGAAEPFAQGKPLDYWTLLLHQAELQVAPGEWTTGADPFAELAIRSLGFFGPDAAPAVPELLAWFAERTAQEEHRDLLGRQLVRTLQRVGPGARAALPLLLSLRPVGKLRREGGPLAELQQAIDHALFHIAPDILARLSDDGFQPPDVSLLCRLLMEGSGSDSDLRHQLGLFRPGPRAKDAIPFLSYRYRKDGRADIGAALLRVDPELARKLFRSHPESVRKALLEHLEWLHLDPSPLTGEPSAAPAVQAWMDRLRSPKQDVRDAALDQLRRMPRPPVPVLLEMLDDRQLWYVALDLLPRRGLAAKDGVPRLRRLCREKDRMRATRAAWALAWIEPEQARKVAPQLLGDLKDEGASVREHALLTLGKLGNGDARIAATLCDRLGKDRHRVEVVAAVYGLLSLGKVAVPPLVERLGADDLQTRCNAAWVLARLGPAARDALPALKPLVGDHEPLLRLRAAFALARLDPASSEQAVKVLLECMKEQTRAGREAAVALGRLAREIDLAEELGNALAGGTFRLNAALAWSVAGPKGPAVKVMTKILEEEKTPQTRRFLLHAIAGRGQQTREAVPLLHSLWSDESLGEEVTRTLTAILLLEPKGLNELLPVLKEDDLKRLSPTLRAIGPDGLKALDDKVLKKLPSIPEELLTTATGLDRLIAQEMRLSLRRQFLWLDNGRRKEFDLSVLRRGGPEAIRKALAALDSKSIHVRRRVLYALGLAGEAAKEAVPRVQKMAVDGDDDIREAALLALWMLRPAGASDKILAGRLGGHLGYERPDIRLWALDRLAELGPAARSEIGAVRRMLKHRDAETRALVALVLAGLEPKDRELGRALPRLLHEDEVEVRMIAMEAAGRLGPQGKELLADLPYRSVENVTALNRETWPTRARSLLTAVQIDPKSKRDIVPGLIDAYLAPGRWEHGIAGGVVRLIGEIGPDGKETVKRLARIAAKDTHALDILQAFGPQAKAAAPMLLDLLQGMKKEPAAAPWSREERWRAESLLGALEAIVPDPKQAVPILRKLHAEFSDPAAYLPVARLLKKLDPAAAREAGIP